MSMKLFCDKQRFYRANLHTHTTQSDGAKTPAEALSLYRSLGYDIVALTDHRKVTVPDAVPDDLLWLPGIELDYTLDTQVAHILGVGISENVIDGGYPADAQAALDAINADGGCAIVAHPAWSLNTTAFLTGLRGAAATEVWNSVSTIPYNAMRGDSAAILDTAAANGWLTPFVASDDTHFYGAEVARGWTMIQAAELTVPAVLEAIRAGRFYATQGPEIHQVEINGDVMRVTCSAAEAIVFSSNTPWVDKRTFVGGRLTAAEYKIQPKDTFVRCHIIDAQGRTAWTSPVKV